VAATPATTLFAALTRRHGVKCFLRESLTIEAYVRAMAKVVRPSCVVAASKIYSKAVFFLKSEAATHKAVEQGGISVGGTYVPVEPIPGLGTKVVLSNEPPFLRYHLLRPLLEALGVIKSPISLVPLGCRDPTLRHILSFHCQLVVVLQDRDDMEGSFEVSHEDTTYKIFYSSEGVHCYGCREPGHIWKNCPTAPAPALDASASTSAAVPAAASSEVVPAAQEA
uniref:CCHC-type domain-containing protein n=1 Tax=Latimeria chalumnae TaxID=7897 RepID=H3AD24_LATCH